MTSQDFPTSVVARVLKEIRVKRGLSAERLADRMKERGVPFDKTVIANLETGRRRYISVAELLALADVLDIAPVDLIVPREITGDPYQVTPTTAAPADTVREWIRGENLLTKAASGRIGNAAISVSTTAAQILRFVESMPEERGNAVMRRLMLAEQREWQREEIRRKSAEEDGTSEEDRPDQAG